MIHLCPVTRRWAVICLLLTVGIATAGRAHAGDFEIDEIITAIKNEIITANITELGSPRFTIEKVDVALAVVSSETEKGGLAITITGFSDDFDNGPAGARTYHMLNYSFQPAAASSMSPDLSLGLVEPIRGVKSAFRKACNTPPGFQMNGFTFTLEFALVQTIDGGIRFRILDLDDLKARYIKTHHVTLHVKAAN